MCGRYALFGPLSRHTRAIELDELPSELEPPPRYNIAPTMPCSVFAADAAGLPQLVTLAWGFAPRWLEPGKKQVNATLERAPESRMFRRAWHSRRCAVPADGWYEWKATAKPKTPYFLRRSDDTPLYFAGLHENDTFAILTTTPQASIAPLHDRMPLLLAPDQVRPWLRIGELDATREHPLLAYPVSRRVNSHSNEGPELIRPDHEAATGTEA